MIFVFIILLGLIIISSAASQDLRVSLAFVIIQEALMRSAELTYCIAVLVTYQKNIKEPMSSSSGHTGKSMSRPASQTFFTDTDSRRTEDHSVVSPTAQVISPSDNTETATPSTAN